MKNKIKACIFDLDGTLLDTPSGVAHHINAVFSEENIPAVTKDEARAFMGNGARNLILTALASRGITDVALCERVYEKYIKHYDAAPDVCVEVYEGVTEMIFELRKMGIALAVLSNKPHYATSMLIEKYFPNSFDVVLGGCDGIPLKPAPDGVRRILSTLGVDASECAYVGDSEPDVYTARYAELGFPIFVLWGLRTREQLELVGAKTLASSPEEITEIIKTENGV